MHAAKTILGVKKQLSQKHLFATSIDRHVLSEGRQWQVLRNRDTAATSNFGH